MNELFDIPYKEMSIIVLTVASLLMLSGCSGVYYSHKKVPIKASKIMNYVEDMDLIIDIERCKSDDDQCYKILDAIHNGSVNIEGINWSNFEVTIKETK